MFLGDLSQPRMYLPFLKGAVWHPILTWLEEEAPHLKNGKYELDGRNIHATISTETTLHRNERVFEAHRQYIDIHCCLAGAEVIDRVSLAMLDSREAFDEQKDCQFFDAPLRFSSILMTPGTFIVLVPQDVHRTLVFDGKNRKTRKVVVKLNAKLVI
ncbi:MAG: YhcH/YjgK/YiaL family protein [Candidatus Andersenbacteria bacterium]